MATRPSAALLPVAAIVLLFLPALVAGDSIVWSPDSDLAAQYLPYLNFLAGSDSLPARNPIPFAGTPAIGNLNAPVAYPPAAVYLAWPSGWWLTVVLVGHLCLLALGMYRLARSFGHSPLAGAFAGIAIALSARAFGHVWAGHLWLICAWAWLPWAVLPARGISSRPGQAVALALVLGMSLLTGALQVAYFTVVVVMLTAIVSSRPGWRPVLGSALLVIGATAAAALAAAATLLPGWLAARESVRAAGLDPAFAATFSLGFGDLPGLLLPLHLGHPAEGTFWAGLNFWERSTTPGAAVAVFALVGLATPGDRRRWWLLGGVVLAVAFAMGERTPVFPALFRALPGLDHFRVPARAMLLVVPALALLAARGFDLALGMTGGDRLRLSRWVLPALAGALVVGTLAWIVFREPIARWGAGPAGGDLARAGRAVVTVQRSLVFAAALWIPLVLLIRIRESGALLRRGFAMAVFAVMLAEAWLMGGRFLMTRKTDELRAGTAVSRAIEQHWPEGRVLDRAGALPPGIAQARGIALIGGYDPMVSDRYVQLTDLMADLPSGPPETRIRAESTGFHDDWRWGIFEDLCGIGLLSTEVITLPGFRRVADVEDEVGRTIFLSERQAEPGAVRRVDAWAAVEDRDAAVAALKQGRGVVVEGGEGPPARGRAGSVVVQVRKPDLYLVKTVGDERAMLLFSEAWSGSWAAWVDGVRTPVRPANVGLIAVAVPVGASRVMLRAEKTPFHAGILVSLVSGSVLLMAFGVLARRSRRRRGPALSSGAS